MTAPDQQITFDPRSQSGSETHANLFVVRLSLAQLAHSTASVPPENSAITFWDSISGGGMSRNVTKRRRPGQPMPVKIAGLHIDVAPITLTRAWNRRLEHREPVQSMIMRWLGAVKDGLIAGINVRATQMYLDEDTGKYVDYDFYEGPIQAYEGPKANTDGEDLAKETITIDPSNYGRLDFSATATSGADPVTGTAG